MATIRVSGLDSCLWDRKLTLNNGDIIVTLARGAAVDYFMVSSYRGELKREPYATRPKDTRNYCNFINLATGYPTLEEPCPRSTSLFTVLEHLTGVPQSNSAYIPNDIMQIKSREYAIMITPTEEEEHGTD